MSTTDRLTPVRTWLIRLVARLGILLVVALVAGSAHELWNYSRRRAAVDRLLAIVPTGVRLERGPSSPIHDPTIEGDRRRYLAELRGIRNVRAERLVVPRVIEVLRSARLRHDRASMCGALAVLQWLAPASGDAAPEVIRTIQEKSLRSDPAASAIQVRVFAIHVLGVIAADDPAALAALIAALDAPDDSDQRIVAVSAANELGGLGPRAETAIPVLVRLAMRRDPAQQIDMLRRSAISALCLLGPSACTAVPQLIGIAQDRHDPCRLDAIKVIGCITVNFRMRIPQPGVSSEISPDQARALAEGIAGLRPLLEDNDPAIRAAADMELHRLGGFPKARQ